jgi:hypothetical protein
MKPRPEREGNAQPIGRDRQSSPVAGRVDSSRRILQLLQSGIFIFTDGLGGKHPLFTGEGSFPVRLLGRNGHGARLERKYLIGERLALSRPWTCAGPFTSAATADVVHASADRESLPGTDTLQLLS